MKAAGRARVAATGGERAAAEEEDGGGFRRAIICIGERRFRLRFVSSIVFFVVDECMRVRIKILAIPVQVRFDRPHGDD